MSISKLALAGVSVLALAAPLAAQTARPAAPAPAAANDPMAKASPDMRRVLAELQRLGAKPVETLTPDEARIQPTPGDAARAVLDAENVAMPPTGVTRTDMTYPGPAGRLSARVYKPAGAGPFPVVL